MMNTVRLPSNWFFWWSGSDLRHIEWYIISSFQQIITGFIFQVQYSEYLQVFYWWSMMVSYDCVFAIFVFEAKMI